MLLGKGREPVGRREAFICMRANRRYHEKGGPETKRGIPLGGGERPTGGEGTGRDGVGGRQQRVIWDTKASGRNGRGAPPALFLFLLFPSCLIGAFMVGIVHGRVGGKSEALERQDLFSTQRTRKRQEHWHCKLSGDT